MSIRRNQRTLVRSAQACALLAAAFFLLSFAASASDALPAGRERIVIGATLPLSGREAKPGSYIREGLELAFERANAEGGLLVAGRRLPVELSLLDDRGDPDHAGQLVEKLVREQQARFLLGTYSSALTERQSAVAERLGVPYLAGVAGASEIFRKNRRWVFGFSAPTKMEAYVLLDWMLERQRAGELPKPVRLAIAVLGGLAGNEFRQGVRNFAERYPGVLGVVVDESFELDVHDFRPLLQTVARARADAFIAYAHVQNFIDIHSQYLAAGMCHRMLSYGLRGSEQEAILQLGRPQLDYVFSVTRWDEQAARDAESAAFTRAFRERYHSAPQWYQAVGYEMARVLFRAVEKANSLDREAVRQSLSTLRISSLVPGGQISFPAAYGGQAHYPYLLRQNLPDGSMKIVYPSYASNGTGVVNPHCSPVSAASREQ
jgi:branched-chain amino acid transport system substrate-binding protein